MPFQALAAIPAAAAAAAGKAAAGVGTIAAGTAVSYGVIRGIQKAEGQPTPQVSDSILTSASETESESIIAFNFGGSTSIIVIIVVILVGSFIVWRCCSCCLPT